MRHATTRVSRVIAGLAFIGLCATGCTDHRSNEPRVAQVDFTPKKTISVDDEGLAVGSSADAATISLPKGTVIEIRNTGSINHRVQGWISTPGGRDALLYDTGIMFPGDSTIVMLSTVDTVTFTDVDARERTLSIDVTAKS